MKTVLQFLSLAGLLLVLIPALMHFAGYLDFERQKQLMLAGTFLWFGTATFWLGKKNTEEKG